MEEIIKKMNVLSQEAAFYESLAQANRRLAEYYEKAELESDSNLAIQIAIEKQKQAIAVFSDLENLIKSINEPQKIIKPNLSTIPIMRK